MRQLSTTQNLSSTPELNQSQLLGFIPLSNVDFGEYFSTIYENPCMKDLQNGEIHELDFNFKVVWHDRTKKLNNHNQPLDLELNLT